MTEINCSLEGLFFWGKIVDHRLWLFNELSVVGLKQFAWFVIWIKWFVDLLKFSQKKLNLEHQDKKTDPTWFVALLRKYSQWELYTIRVSYSAKNEIESLSKVLSLADWWLFWIPIENRFEVVCGFTNKMFSARILH